MPLKSKLVKYVQKHFERELSIVRSRVIEKVEPALSVEERTLIYKYSEDGYEGVNLSLRDSFGQNPTEFGVFLDETLKKLPDYKGLVYRSANLTPPQIQKYIDALEKNTILVEHSFISTSAYYSVANMFSGNCKFEMISRSGKSIESYAKYGTDSGQNEHEILFRPNSEFLILDVTKMNGYTLIVMEEI